MVNHFVTRNGFDFDWMYVNVYESFYDGAPACLYHCVDLDLGRHGDGRHGDEAYHLSRQL